LEEWVQERIEEHRTQLAVFLELCAEIREQTANVALAWLLGFTAPSSGCAT
jgi:hypothetical protein